MKNTQGEVWVFAEQEEGKLSEVPFELLGKARELADRLGVKVGAVLMGSGVEALAKPLFEGGADVVHLVDDPALKVYRNKAYRHAMVELVKEVNPQIAIFGATHMGRDLAPSVASALRCGLTADCTDLQIGDYTDKKTGEEFKNVLMQIRPAFGGNIIATIVNSWDDPQMVTVREGVMKLGTPDPSRKGEIERVKVALSTAETVVKVIERVRAEKSVDLRGAQIIVAGGYGVGSAANFKLIRDLAEALGGEVGASRAAVDAGWIDHDHQVGQTGVTVRPRLYIACGISGAIQHRAGMSESKKIIAINTDPDAPIMACAHYAIIGDLNTVIPEMIKAFKAKQ